MEKLKDTGIVGRALVELAGLAVRQLSPGLDAVKYALGWLVAARYSTQVAHIELEQFADFEGWAELERAGLSMELCAELSGLQGDVGATPQAMAIVRSVVAQLPDEGWAFTDAIWHLRQRFGQQLPWSYEPSLCDLVVRVLGAGLGHRVWVPYDHSGQICARLVRAGAQVVLGGPGQRDAGLASLILALEADLRQPSHLTVLGVVGEAGAGRDEITHCYCAPPWGLRVGHGMYPPGWSYQFKQHRFLRTHVDDVDRAEAWSIAAMWPQVESRAVFLMSHSFLFGQGQESKLRQELVEPKNQISAVLNLPPGLMGMTNIPGGLLVLDAHAEPNVRMMDISGQTIDGRSKQRFGKDLDVAGVMDYYEGHDDVPQLATDAIAPEIASCDYSLMPTRYTRRIHSLGDDLVPLEDLVLQVLRAPPAVKDGVDGIAVWEISPGQLDRWQPIEAGFDRWTEVMPRKLHDAVLRPRDLLVSIKGAVGKVGIVGDVSTEPTASPQPEPVRNDGKRPSSNSVVPSAMCVALRVDTTKVLPEFLLLFLRSDLFKLQVEALKVGTTVGHVTPAALLSGVRVPLPTLDVQHAMWEADYLRLRELEMKAEQIQEDMARLRANLFSRPAVAGK